MRETPCVPENAGKNPSKRPRVSASATGVLGAVLIAPLAAVIGRSLCSMPLPSPKCLMMRAPLGSWLQHASPIIFMRFECGIGRPICDTDIYLSDVRVSATRPTFNLALGAAPVRPEAVPAWPTGARRCSSPMIFEAPDVFPSDKLIHGRSPTIRATRTYNNAIRDHRRLLLEGSPVVVERPSPMPTSALFETIEPKVCFQLITNVRIHPASRTPPRYRPLL